MCLAFTVIACRAFTSRPTQAPTIAPAQPGPPTITPAPTPTTPVEVESLTEMLETAYKDDDTDLLLDFFVQWQNAYAPRNKEEIASQSEIVQAAYEIYGEFYTPFDLERIGESEWGPDIYEYVQFVVIQSELAVETPEMETAEVIRDFRPDLELEGAEALYLSQEYRQVLEGFLSEADHGREELISRLEFLNQFIRIYPGHWGGWHLETHPLVSSITLDSELTKAIVYFRLIYQGGEAQFRKRDGQWKMIDSKLTWIE
jgi:hypothetical protein